MSLISLVSLLMRRPVYNRGLEYTSHSPFIPTSTMCKSPLHPFLHALPKCEQHLHLEGTLSPELLFRLAALNNVALPSTTDDPAFESPATLKDRYEHFTSLDDFLHYYFIGNSVLLTANDFETLAYEYFTRAHADGVVHAEVFFDPQGHTTRGVAYAMVVEGFTRAQAQAERDFGITSKLILCFLRNLPVPDADKVFKDVTALEHFSNGTVVGIGMDSSEVGYPPELFKDIYAAAAEKGIRRTAHAGEEGDSTYISRAVDLCKVERIDHGIRLADDKELMKRVAEQKILVTMCPISNVKLRCVTELRELPIKTFLDNGVNFSINSDDPAYFGGYILDNYCAVQEAFELTLEDWMHIAQAAVNGSWCNNQRKDVLMKQLAACLNKFNART
jgi:adenosine deaminase